MPLPYLLLLCFFLAQPLSGQYAISGRVNLGIDWQPKIYLAAIDKLSDYYRTSPDMIVNTAIVNPDGSFEMRGDNLPKEDLFYRLYLMKKQNTDYDACLYVGGEDHNFAHLILNNDTQLSLLADTSQIAPFGNYRLSSNEANKLMEEVSRIVYPRFYFYRIKFPTELKFSEDKLHQDLLSFADTCKQPLVALAAVNNTDFDAYFERDRKFYVDFGSRLQHELPRSTYTRNYLLKLNYYANEESEDHSFYFLGFWLILGLWVTTGLGWYYQRRNSRQSRTAPSVAATDGSFEKEIDLLTQKELEILTLIGEGKSNKEIANALFVEVSTVKTHINKIYSKTGVANRKEARTLAKKVFNGGD